MTVAAAISRAIDQAAGKRRAVLGSHACLPAVLLASISQEIAPPSCWSVLGMNSDPQAPSRPMPTP